ncbi:hypothetical protein [Algoriphagus sp.]|uniref:hypothetical protein n=1 Tax=Algoriphagus sp. TaxID=1872435 RepID=UPI00391C0A43
MKTYDKALSDLHELLVVPSVEERRAYFLRNCETNGFATQLDFKWLKKGKSKASLTLAISETEAVSLPMSPFGGIWIEDLLSSEALEAFIKAVLEDLRGRKISCIRISQAPKPYEPNFDLINYILFKLGFKQESILSHQFFIGKKKIKKFVLKENSKYSKKIKELGLKIETGPIQNFGFLQEIRAWNNARGYNILFDDARLISQVSDFPERYFLVSILKDGSPIAHILGVKLTLDSIYYFLSATLPKSEIKNLGELGLFHLFHLASDQKLNFVDLGSSDLNVGPNHSLIFFKSRFSNDISNKVTWTLTL